MKVLVSGTRKPERDTKTKVWEQLDDLHDRYGVELVIHGDAVGVDHMAAQWAEEKGIAVAAFRYPGFYGRRGGMIRNGWMLKYGQPDFVLAFPRAESGGTWNMIMQAGKAKVHVRSLVIA